MEQEGNKEVEKKVSTARKLIETLKQDLKTGKESCKKTTTIYCQQCQDIKCQQV